MEIDISALLEVETATAVINTSTIRAIRGLVDADSSTATFNCVFQRAIFSTLEADDSLMQGALSALVATRSTMDIDRARADITLNAATVLESCFDASSTAANIGINKIANNSLDWDLDESEAFISLNSSKSLGSLYNCDRSSARLNYLYLKNPPLPPKLDTRVTIRSANNLPLNKSQLVANNTYTLDAIVNGQRLDGTSFTFTVRPSSSIDVVLLQKSSINTPSEYLVTKMGIGDIFVSTPTPVINAKMGNCQEITATIVIKPDDFKVMRNTVFYYQLWAYDALGTNTLLEAGTFSVNK